MDRDTESGYKYIFNIGSLLLHNMSSGSELGLATMYRVIKKAGAERVSDDGADELRKILEELALKIARQAVDLCIHAGRKTIKSEDISLAAKNVLNMR